MNAHNRFCLTSHEEIEKEKSKKRCEQHTDRTHSDKSNVIFVIAIKTFGTSMDVVVRDANVFV